MFVPGFARSISPEKFLDQLVVQFSLPQQCKEAEIDVYKYFCDFIVGSQYHGSGGKLLYSIIKFSCNLRVFCGIKIYHSLFAKKLHIQTWKA